jgi:hypothetical protein
MHYHGLTLLALPTASVDDTLQTSRPNDMKKIPDYQTFTVSVGPSSYHQHILILPYQIFDESLEASGSEKALNAVITIHTSAVVTVDLEDPGKPEPGTVNEGYNEDLDRPHPSEMDQLLELSIFHLSLIAMLTSPSRQTIAFHLRGG